MIDREELDKLVIALCELSCASGTPRMELNVLCNILYANYKKNFENLTYNETLGEVGASLNRLVEKGKVRLACDDLFSWIILL